MGAMGPADEAMRRRARLDHVDLLRGIIMVVMSLDHIRDYLSYLPFPPEDMQHTWPALFFTRWITHFCAPWFCFLAGTGAYLALSRGKAPSQTQSLLWKRGLWLIVLEWTVVGFGWTFLPSPFPIALVLWMLGWSMISLSFLVKLPVKWIAAIGIAMILLHNLADPLKPAQFGHFAWLWQILHVQGFIASTPPHLLFGKIPMVFGVIYPLLPWPGVMAAGYAFGAVMPKPAAERHNILLWLGSACVVLFIVLRATNIYGNPHAPGVGGGDFHPQATVVMTLIAFLDTAKYPPSLQFLLMTLGPGFLALAIFDRIDIAGRGIAAAISRFFLVYGRVPMFYYVLHIYLLHLMAIVAARFFRQPVWWLFHGAFFTQPTPPGYGHDLPFVYLMWMVAVGLLYYPCKRYMEFKRRHRDWNWLSYF